MKTVKVTREDLLKIVKENRANHRSMFERAMEGYRKEAIAELERAIADAKKGKRIVRHLSLVEPIDQTKDYDRVIAMLEMSVDETIVLSANEFAQYVQDDWSWKEQFLISNTRYLDE